MKRYIALLSLAALAAGTGCCASRQCSPCGGGGFGYGAGYAPTFQQQPSCPGGNCGPMYQSGALTPTSQQAMIPGSTTAYTPYYSTASLDYLPAY
ncbi:MAG TPA: hypothetical protein VNQ76_01555 [Planctomicrobium sp.]|nr:hypothetical protein [Planctomicrobium sp.]